MVNVIQARRRHMMEIMQPTYVITRNASSFSSDSCYCDGEGKKGGNYCYCNKDFNTLDVSWLSTFYTCMFYTNHVNVNRGKRAPLKTYSLYLLTALLVIEDTNIFFHLQHKPSRSSSVLEELCIGPFSFVHKICM